MESKEKEQVNARKKNMRIYSVHRMLTFDLLFYYAIKFLFLTQVKGFTASDIVTVSAFLGLFKVLFQIPITVVIDKIGNRRSLIIADLFQATSVTVIMLSNSLPVLIIGNLFGAIAVAMKDVAEPGLLNSSIPDVKEKSQIYSKIDGKSVGNFYYISAFSAIVSGFLFDINGYIPMTICVIILLISALLATGFTELTPVQKQEDIKKYYKTYFRDLKLAFSFIFNSSRLKALMLFSGVMYGIIMVMNTYEMGLLDEMGLSASITGIIYAIMQIVAGISSKHHEKIHQKYKNKTLSIVGVSYTLACLMAGIIAVTGLPYWLIIGIIVATYAVRYLSTGFYYVLIKKYITNFTNGEVANKVYSAHSFVIGLGNLIICAFGAVISSNFSVKHSMIIFGIVFFTIMILILNYMRTRVGLDPSAYRKKDINYKEYIGLK
jgi:MFS family permease